MERSKSVRERVKRSNGFGDQQAMIGIGVYVLSRLRFNHLQVEGSDSKLTVNLFKTEILHKYFL